MNNVNLMHHSSEGNPLLEYFISNGGRSIHKWVDYFDVYHRTFSKYRGKKITFLEIGVQNGGSLQMWRHYFGPQAKIIGVDVNENCKNLEAEGFEIWIGDQADPDFWRQFIAKNPAIDIVLDDGGHTMVQQITTFESLFPVISNNGCFLCEDTHSSYLQTLGGELRGPNTFITFAKNLIDEMHAWYYAPLKDLDGAYMAKNLYAVSIFDSIVVMEKRIKNPPMVLARGYDGHINNPAAMTLVEMRRAFNVPE